MLGHRGHRARLVGLTKRERRYSILLMRLQAEILKMTRTVPSEARPSIVVPAARRKRLAHKPHADSRASEMDLSGDDFASDGGNIYPIDHPLDHSELRLMLFHLYVGERGDGEMSPDPAPHDCVFSGEPDSPYQVEKPAEAADVRETINVGSDSANPGTSTIDNVLFRWHTKELNDSEFVHSLIVSMLLALLDKLQEANVDLGNRKANTPIRGLLVDTPMLHFMYGSPQINDHMPEDMFPESTLPKNPKDGPSEDMCLSSS
ncbi:uncharacterized protein A4U43_C02F17580 [Asparagus officinalis]|uniref:Uncharacterized protein n=1 Tax=Asparagus officinalis TaxID=4686 RepID=A0A5P1FJ47_ASPOF|nr:uncharacterized protein A4U43_C02F17580 [Asparagus officinalis]